ncbi:MULTISPECIES: response regulator [Burkholderia]|nr:MULTISPECIES: response regulator [Burkholderia]MBJ9624005.1 response regulator [Burkholderia multivorans]MBJ9656888.1 response regulator [Burkholderia multivorans]MBJ9682873.1 response regulator [Burkholderia multivorans]MBU9471206.1 response regulator [Burkholderia multivorans]OFT87532.1 hypothetical protein HMPREF3115_15520 [Burkholderia sp. HMSC10F09]
MSSSTARRLLIADDDSALVTAYAQFFSLYGYAIQTANDGASALDLYRDWRPDVVMLDIQMPRMDGWAVARAIRSMNIAPSPLLVAMTALDARSDQTASFNAGFDHHFVKPVELGVILAVLATRASEPPARAK